MNCIVIDDEPIALAGMADYVNQTPFLKLVGSCESAFEAMEMLNKHSVDLLFLDINMPKLTGIEFLKTLRNQPYVIFATANPNHALEGFELDAIDYLLKPIRYSKFLKASQKAYELFQLRNSTQTNEEQSIFIKVDKDLVKIMLNDILYIEGLKDYISVKTKEAQYITYLSLGKMLDSLPSKHFLQVHKSYIVNINAIEKLYGNLLYIDGQSIPIGRTHKEKVLAKIVGDKIVKK